MIFGFQLDIYEDFIYANNLIRKNIQSNKMSKYLVGKAIKMYILRTDYIAYLIRIYFASSFS